jgi:hypothetical protein
MSYSQAYHLDCEQSVDQYNSACCIPTEFGRVRSVAFIRKAYLQQILSSDPENLTYWTDGIASSDIVVLTFTTGTFDSGVPQKLKGYGRRTSTHGPRLMQLNFFIPADKNNFSFFDDLNFRTDYVPAFRTGSWLHLFDSAADIITKEVIEEDLEGSVLWSVECTVRSRNLPRKYDASLIGSVFSCNTTPTTITHRILLETADRWLTESGGFWLHE